jgi:hypothetical protein
MSQRRLNSRVLRKIAEDVVQQLAAETFIPESEQHDYATSLVRQWITYDGNASLFLGEQQVYFPLAKTPDGGFSIVPAKSLGEWTKALTKEWKISPDDLDEIFGQLNRGQSAEIVNGDGVPLRLWVNPKERSRGVEPLVKQAIPPGTKRDYHKIATNVLERHVGELDPDELEALACSVAKQWQQHEGYACLFLNAHQQLVFTLTEKDDGGCSVTGQRLNIDLEAVLSSHGFSPDVLEEIIARINLGQEIQFRNRQGVRSRLWHDPKARRICVQALEPPQPKLIMCPNCTGVFPPWQEGERQKTCVHCGYRVTLP